MTIQIQLNRLRILQYINQRLLDIVIAHCLSFNITVKREYAWKEESKRTEDKQMEKEKNPTLIGLMTKYYNFLIN